jgi:hypothetical protein
MVLAMLVNREGKALDGSAVKGQLYVSADEVVVLRPTAAEALLHRAMLACLWGSVALVLANLVWWQRQEALWAAIALQAAYWLTLPRRRRALEPAPLDEAALQAAKRAGRAAIAVPSGAVTGAEPPRPPGAGGFRTPARLLLPDGALEIYLGEQAFSDLRRALGRDG